MEVQFDQDRQFFNKWEMYKLLSGTELACHLPKTKMLTKHTLNDFISTYTSFVIKPIDLWAGRWLSIIEKKKNVFVWKKQGHPIKYFYKKEQITKALLYDYKGKKCIIQEKAPILSYLGRPFDIRSHMQRDKNDKWIYVGDVVRVGGNRSYVSNVFTGYGGIADTSFILRRLLQDEVKEKDVKRKLKKVTHQITDTLDEFHYFVDIGPDFGVDTNGGIWLLEVNTDDTLGRPDYKLFKKLPNTKLYTEMKKREVSRNEKWLQERLRNLGFLDGIE
ncbi:YheC/YheD family protein [Aquibacillus sp. 3ASR75-11]|uniref:YheC/YheD family protein n=1 Tax=Terrihalobacillus insolitus TaxID=2950438 RepID=A0A9X3WYY4_9BACI|nr:YheC/YheD family protein [Terrihalobacillus insolitus]MDC3414996.1 YheC/YheD family protein [Terrihalobacillus insolitus]MDC3425869.1 YheC/YheD family protein [Terrihalobacillus insolitus]